MVFLGEIAGQHGQADAEDGQLAVADFPAGGDGHHFLAGKVAHGVTSAT